MNRQQRKQASIKDINVYDPNGNENPFLQLFMLTQQMEKQKSSIQSSATAMMKQSHYT